MASTINALTTGVGGIQTTGDTSGNISLQSNGSNVLNTTSSGVSVPGTLAVTGTSTFTGAMSANGGLAVTGTLTVNGVAPGRSGASYITLTTGTTNVTLTSASNQVQYISCDLEGCSITLPNMTTLSTGSGYFVFYNTSSFAIAVKDAGGTVREYLYPSSSNYGGVPSVACPLNIESIATSNGVWHIQNPISGGSYSSTYMTNTTATLTAATYFYVLPVSTTQFIVVGNSGGAASAIYIKLATLNTSTKTFTFGSEITLSTIGSTNTLLVPTIDWNGTDRGVISFPCRVDSIATAVYVDVYGFAIVAGTLYVSSRSQINIGNATNGYNSYGASSVFYSGNNCFFVTASMKSGSSTWYMKLFGYSVGVSGTTVSITQAVGPSYSNTSDKNYLIAPTSQSTFVVDRSDQTTTITYISYDTSSNTISSGNRTSQTTAIVDVLIPSLDTSRSFVQASNSKMIYGAKVALIANAGTASVTVSNPSYNLKAFPTSLYTSVSTGVGVSTYYAQSATSYYAYNSGTVYNFDPTNTNFNFNQIAFTPPGTYNYYNSSLQIVSINYVSASATTGTISCNVVSPASPFVL